MSIRLRLMALIGSFGITALLITGLALVSLQRYKTMMTEYGAAYEHAYDIERINHMVSNVVMESRGIYLSQDTAEARVFSHRLSHNLDELDGLLNEWRQSKDPEERARYAEIEPAVRDFLTKRRDMVRLTDEGKIAQVTALGKAGREDRIRLQQTLDTLVAEAHKDLAQTQAEAAAFSEQRGRTFLIMALVSIAGILCLSAVAIMHFITRPLRHVAGTIISLSEGKLDTPVPEETDDKGEVAELWRAIARLKAHAIEAEKIVEAQREAERLQALEARQLILD
ncbi:MCP four helix bundle domain-containing protein [Asticcacaulis sp. DXS10W]|uniref:MCP four helix bundle domain-containing protein n=1 Tax=Asticcacaulis currens TaxID=2984210 RepID=A0ABT5IER9_9CAUL|nr:MCP four helix bundle domain-containing protein [Asticcacaulis currens]MDC7694664.1 MCP four helix bundle domain-containing protein [Asticcacaulis currens]